jgi:hypothetical protein
MQLAMAILLKHGGVALIFGQLPELRANQRMGLRCSQALLLSPGNVGDDILDRSFPVYPGLGHPRLRDAGKQRLPVYPSTLDHAEELRLLASVAMTAINSWTACC